MQPWVSDYWSWTKECIPLKKAHSQWCFLRFRFFSKYTCSAFNIIHRIHCNDPSASHSHAEKKKMLLEWKLSHHELGSTQLSNIQFHFHVAFFKKICYTYRYIVCIYICVPQACLASMEDRRGNWIFWSYWQLWMALWMLSNESGSFGRIGNECSLLLSHVSSPHAFSFFFLNIFCYF